MLKIKDNVDLKELEKFGFKPKYNEDTGEVCAYEKKIEKYECGLVISVFETKSFIRLFVTTKNGWALRQFIDGISDYLSAYVKRAPDTGSRNRARKKLRNLLYNQSAHIQYIIAENKRTQEIAIAKKQARLEQSLKDRAAAAAKKQELENKTTKRPRVYIPKQEFENTRNALINQKIINLNTKSRQ